MDKLLYIACGLIRLAGFAPTAVIAIYRDQQALLTHIKVIIMKYGIAFVLGMFAVAWVLLQIVAYLTVIQSMILVFVVFYVANKIMWALFGTRIVTSLIK